MKLRLISRIIVISLVVLVGGFMLLRGLLANSQGQTPLQGTNLGGTAAPDFALIDQNGRQVSLASLRGHPVVLSFMDTHCPGDCAPATKQRTVMQALGSVAQDVHWVAVSINPAGDTPAAAQNFVRQYQLVGMRYLLGNETQLAHVWRAYAVAVDSPGSTATAGGASGAQLGGLYVIDDEGRERVYLDSNFAPSMLEGDLRALL